MPRRPGSVDVDQIDFSEAISQNVIFSGSVKIANIGPKGNPLVLDADGHVSGSDFLVIDSANNRIGIGIATPQEHFHIHGNSATLRLGNGLNSGEHSPKLQLSELANSDGDMTYGHSIAYNGTQNRLEIKRHSNSESGATVITVPRNASEVGIATPGNPEATLHVYGGDSSQTFSNVDGIAIENAGSSNGFYAFQIATPGGGGKWFTATNAGRIGIGKDDPGVTLDVSGNFTLSGTMKATSLGAENDIAVVGADNSLTSSTQLKVDSLGNIAVANDMFVSGNLKTENNISFVDENGTFPTNTAGFFWDLNNDEARIYAKQPASDQIDFVFKLSDNNNSVDRYLFWIDDYRGGSYDRYPLMMHGEGVFFQMTETSEGVPNTATSRARIDSQGRLGLNCDGTSDPSTVVNHAHIYSKLVSGHAEMFVRDSNGNVTQISPHTPEGEWQYFSKNTRTGKVVRVNMEKMIRKLEKITGESFMEEWYEEPD